MLNFPPMLLPPAASDPVSIWGWLGFLALIAAMLALDLGVFQAGNVVVKTGAALGWCAVWFGLAALFAGGIATWLSRELAEQFVSGYLLELCLSVDNIFVFILIFAYFGVEAKYQHRVLFWGIIGAVVIRTLFIVVGISVISRFHWVLYIFGGFLVYTGLRLAWPRKPATAIDPSQNLAVRIFRQFYPVAPANDDGRFFTLMLGRRSATPLFIVLIVIETTDIMLALDSIPAVLSITSDAFIALTSNIFAILGLRSLYFALQGVIQLFRFLKFGLAALLIFIGIKMLVVHWWRISAEQSLAVIGSVLALSILLSLLPRRPDATA